MIRSLFIIPLLFFVAFCSVPDSAQQIFTPIAAPIYIPTQTINEQLRNVPTDDRVDQDYRSTAPHWSATQDFTYRYSPQRTRQNLRTFIDKSPNAEAKADLQRIISAQPSLFDDLRAAISPYGLDTHDVADAYTLYWINAWLVANKRDEDPDKGTIAMVNRQVRNAFAATPDFANTNDAERQEYAEALLLQATMLSSAFEQWKNDPKMLDQLANAARDAARASDLNLSVMTLTRNGFVPCQGADASGIVTNTDHDAPTAGSENRMRACHLLC